MVLALSLISCVILGKAFHCSGHVSTTGRVIPLLRMCQEALSVMADGEVLSTEASTCCAFHRCLFQISTLPFTFDDPK